MPLQVGSEITIQKTNTVENKNGYNLRIFTRIFQDYGGSFALSVGPFSSLESSFVNFCCSVLTISRREPFTPFSGRHISVSRMYTNTFVSSLGERTVLKLGEVSYTLSSTATSQIFVFIA